MKALWILLVSIIITLLMTTNVYSADMSVETVKSQITIDNMLPVLSMLFVLFCLKMLESGLFFLEEKMLSSKYALVRGGGYIVSFLRGSISQVIANTRKLKK